MQLFNVYLSIYLVRTRYWGIQAVTKTDEVYDFMELTFYMEWGWGQVGWWWWKTITNK